jgi:hypothetical protein
MPLTPRQCVIALAAWCLFSAGALAESRCALPAPMSALDLLVQKVCVAPSGASLSVDPCACASPNHLRPLAAGEPTPYHKVDQLGAQRHDAVPSTARDGSPLVLAPFDFKPFGVFNLWGDGYDLFLVRDGWASISETRDGGGYSSTFFTTGCQPYNGWVLFPESAIGSGGVHPGRTRVPISGRYWEQNGEDWPGQCPNGYGTAESTAWDWVPGFLFGGADTTASRRIDTLRVVHGLRDADHPDPHSHLEVFYFTVPYGITRWEVWVAAPGDPDRAPIANGCGGETAIHYDGQDYLRQNCRDWSTLQLQAAPEPQPDWPVPARNLLQNFHYAKGTQDWQRAPADAASGVPNWSVRHSTLNADRHASQKDVPGFVYLAVNCAGHCSDRQQIYQDVDAPASAAQGGHYAFGATLRAESGVVPVRVRLVQLGADGAELTRTEITVQAADHNDRHSGAETIEGSATLAWGDAPVRADARTLRFSVMPTAPGTVDVIDAWVLSNRP